MVSERGHSTLYGGWGDFYDTIQGPVLTEADDPGVKTAALEREIEERRRRIQSEETELSFLRERLEAAQQGNPAMKDLKPTQIIVFALKCKNRPVTLRELRSEIERLEISLDLFGERFSYFYTLIKRLERAGKITWENDGILMAG